MLGLVIGMATAQAQTQTVYNSIPKPLPGNVASEGPEAYAFSELGDGFTLSGATGGTLGQVTVVMSSWACQSGNWTASNCVTTPGATFSLPITITVYDVHTGPTPGAQLATTTQTFNIPYRPSSTPAQCGGDASRWVNKKDGLCYHGLAVPISVNFSGSHVATPADNNIIVTVAYNTTHYGYNPIGQSATCFGTSAGCPYDSLNISTDTSAGIFVGLPLDPDGIFVNYTSSANACPGNTTTGVLALDTGCWDGSHPEIQVQANTNAVHHGKGNGP
jgi:hypothetical protein